VLASFQSRKAHRVQVRDKDLFKYLCCMIVVVVGYMAAWTAVTLDNNANSAALLDYR
jgi:G protein-coupled receptor 158